MTIDNKVVIILGVITILLTGFLAFINLMEWYNNTIVQKINGYPFGTEGPGPYYYRSRFLYAAVTFVWGALFLLNLIYAIRNLIKDRRRGTIVGFAVSLILFLVMFIHGQIGAD